MFITKTSDQNPKPLHSVTCMRKLIYIMGCANCGSTLLTGLLGRHSQISTVGELKLTAIKDIDSYLCGCGDRFLDCRFWKSVQLACKSHDVDLNLDHFDTHFKGSGWLDDKMIRTAVRSRFLELVRKIGLAGYPPAKRELSRLLLRNKAIIDAICETDNKPVFLDGSKDPTRLLHLSRSGLFDIMAIHLVRDGRAIIASYKKRSPDMPTNIRLWKSKAIECERAKCMLPTKNLMTLKYEDLCADVEGVLSSLFRFAGVADEARICLKPTACASEHIIGHNSRLSGTKEVKVRGEWEDLLTDSDLKQFRQEDTGINSLYGYK